jgi:pimeloyl-ACP methyl ester carboxylesterase
MENYRDDHRANYVVLGEGPPVICVHGIAASLHDWDYLLPALAQAGFNGYALDLLGHGDSARPDQDQVYGVESVYAHLLDWLDSLSLDRPVTLVGHSLGGYLSLLLALRQPNRVRSLVLVDPFFTSSQLNAFLRLTRRHPELAKTGLSLAPAWLIHLSLFLDPEAALQYPPQKRRQIALDYKRADPQIVNILADLPDLTPRLAQVHTLARVIWGAQDLTLHPKSYASIVAMLPSAEGFPVPNAGHQPHIGQPQVVNSLVLDFLKSTQT